MILGILNLEGYQNGMNCSKVTTILVMYEKMFTTPCVSWVTCQMSSVRCQLSHVTKQIQIGAVSWWKECDQRCLSGLVFVPTKLNLAAKVVMSQIWS